MRWTKLEAVMPEPSYFHALSITDVSLTLNLGVIAKDDYSVTCVMSYEYGIVTVINFYNCCNIKG